MAAPAAPAPVRGSWRRLALGLGAFALAPLFPAIRAFVPIEQTLVLLAAVLAACALAGWRSGGRMSLAIVWVAIAGALLAAPAGPPGSSYDWMARGWILLLAASFGLVSIVIGAEAFFPRALSALAVATSLAFALVLVSPGGPGRVASAMSTEFNRRTDQSIAYLRRVSEQPEWKEMAERSPALERMTADNEILLAGIPEWATVVMPALLAIESLAAMALAWGLFHRMSSVPLGPPLGRLRDFRFNDHLVWGVAVGASIYLLQAFAEGKNAGLNLLVFFGFLYVLRGLGILAWISRTRTLKVVLVVLAIFMWPFAAALAFGLGLGDTWLDLRARIARPSG